MALRRPVAGQVIATVTQAAYGVLRHTSWDGPCCGGRLPSRACCGCRGPRGDRHRSPGACRMGRREVGSSSVSGVLWPVRSSSRCSRGGSSRSPPRACRQEAPRRELLDPPRALRSGGSTPAGGRMIRGADDHTREATSSAWRSAILPPPRRSRRRFRFPVLNSLVAYVLPWPKGERRRRRSCSLRIRSVDVVPQRWRRSGTCCIVSRDLPPETGVARASRLRQACLAKPGGSSGTAHTESPFSPVRRLAESVMNPDLQEMLRQLEAIKARWPGRPAPDSANRSSTGGPAKAAGRSRKCLVHVNRSVTATLPAFDPGDLGRTGEGTHRGGRGDPRATVGFSPLDDWLHGAAAQTPHEDVRDLPGAGGWHARDIVRVLPEFVAVRDQPRPSWCARPTSGPEEESDGVARDPAAADAPLRVPAVRDHARPAPPVAGSAGAQRLVSFSSRPDFVPLAANCFALSCVLVSRSPPPSTVTRDGRPCAAGR